MGREMEPFVFKSEYRLVELTGQTAENLNQLLHFLRAVNGSSIFYHTHQFFFEHHFAEEGFNNDFARWVTQALHEYELGERLNYIDITSFVSVAGLREALCHVVESHLDKGAPLQTARGDELFCFCLSRSFVLTMGTVAKDLTELIKAIKVITTDSLFYHFIESRLRIYKQSFDNDFSFWLANQLKLTDLAAAITEIDPYFKSLEAVRREMIEKLEGF